MTLTEWEKKTGELTNGYISDIRHIYYGTNPNRKELWHLSDYRVTSISGGVMWLTKKDNIST